MKETSPPNITMDHKRDAYGFAVRPQHLQTYRKYADIYKAMIQFLLEEEEQRSNRWKDFLGRHTESNQLPSSGESPISSLEETDGNHKDDEERDSVKTGEEKEAQIRTSLAAIEQMMSSRMMKDLVSTEEYVDIRGGHLASLEEAKHSEDSDDEFYDVEKSDLNQEVSSSDSNNADSPGVHDIQGTAAAHEEYFPWKKELESLVHDGLPMALRGELWQAFVGVRKRRVEGYYNNLLNLESDDNDIDSKVVDASHLNKNVNESEKRQVDAPEKWKGELEKDLPRTFPGHPALHENGRNALRQLLTAYARHNPSVGYCQPMNYFAGLLLMLMPEENAFWTLVGIMDDYFDGYYSEEMIESQVDQLVLEELVRERLPKLVNHLDYLGFQMVWVTGPWFLSVFLNVLPWESVMRVWDVLLFDGSRAMLFRTALALMELYGPALVTTKNTGNATNLLQSLAGSTFDSSQLIFTACMECDAVSEIILGDLRKKHRPAVLADLEEEKSKGLRAWRNSHGLASKLYCFRRGPELLTSANSAELSSNMHSNEDLHLSISDSQNIDEFLNRLSIDTNSDSVNDLKEQVMWLKVGLCRLLEEKRLATLRAEEFETALMEMVEQDNRRLLSAKVEQLEQDVFESRQALKTSRNKNKPCCRF
ncbi:TBC1 domain family member 9B-like isoform X3 [Iris pallida]|uniref:TBC1 domain family member 9B-like isoform X3 n=1 Tax=Iris pallida TaxID=29817 RepID=A0AAX6HJQ9_IRIPA|nr:TBC1 domain family member 9B-like isoform X3 [Iris pallida]